MVRSAHWIIPSVILAAMPKCPVCVAAYVALITGCGISIAAATTIRLALITFCLVALAYLAIRAAHNYFQSHSGGMT